MKRGARCPQYLPAEDPYSGRERIADLVFFLSLIERERNFLSEVL